MAGDTLDVSGQLIAAEYARSAGDRHQTRSVIISEHGMVATSQPLAAQAGLNVLRQGGNAADAAVAASAMMGGVEPMSCASAGIYSPFIGTLSPRPCTGSMPAVAVRIP